MEICWKMMFIFDFWFFGVSMLIFKGWYQVCKPREICGKHLVIDKRCVTRFSTSLLLGKIVQFYLTSSIFFCKILHHPSTPTSTPKAPNPRHFGRPKVPPISKAAQQPKRLRGYGILTLEPQKDCDILQDAPLLPGAPIALLGAGGFRPGGLVGRLGVGMPTFFCKRRWNFGETFLELL